MPQDPAPFQQLIIRVPSDLHDEIKRVAAANDLSMAQAVRRAVRLYLIEASKGGSLPASLAG